MALLHFSRARFPAAFAAGLVALSWAAATPAQQPVQRSTHDVFAFCHDTHDARQRDVKQQAAMLKQLGFDGAGHVGLENVEQRLASLDDAELRLYLAGVTINLTQDIEPQLQALRTALPVLKGRHIVIYAVVTGMPTGTPEGMTPAVDALQKLSDLAAPAGVRIGIYPHTSDWVATVPQAVALAANVKRDNCGVIFNLCHFLRNEPLESLDKVLEQAGPYLVSVTINGADLAGIHDNDWKRLIQPLDQSTFDLGTLLQKLAQHNYTGPIGIMCYGIGGDAQEHLAQSIKAWRRLVQRQLR